MHRRCARRHVLARILEPNFILNANLIEHVLLSSLRKVHAYASDETQLCKSAIAKLKEFGRAGYPRGVLQYMCNVVYTSTQVRTWRYLATTYVPTYL